MAHSEVRVLGTYVKTNIIPPSNQGPKPFKWTKKHTTRAVLGTCALFGVGIIVFGLLGIWTGDSRFGYTAALFALPSFIFGMAGSFRLMDD